MHSLRPVLIVFLGLLVSAPCLAAEEPQRSQVQGVRAFPPSDDLPPRAVMRLGTARFQDCHQGHVVNLTYSPDGRQLATAGTDNTVRLWNTRTGKLIRVFGKNGYSFRDLAFLPDGQRLVTAHEDSHDSLVVIWNTSDGKELREIRVEPRYSIRRIATSSDGKILFATFSGICEWDMVSGKEWRHIGTDIGEMKVIALAPDGRVAATAGDSIVQLWNRADGRLVREWSKQPVPEHDHWSNNLLSFSPDGRLLAVVVPQGDGTIHLGDVALGRYRGKIVPYPGLAEWAGGERNDRIRALMTSPDGKFVIGPKQAEEMIGNQNARINSFAFSPDGKTIISTGQAQEMVRLTEVFSGRERVRFNTRASKVVFAPDGKTVATDSHGGALIWDITGHREAEEIRRNGLSDKELERLWTNLASTDATVAHRAIWTLIAGKKEAVPFLRRRVRMVPCLSAERLKELIERLDADNFQTREQASHELAKWGESVKPALVAAASHSRSG